MSNDGYLVKSFAQQLLHGPAEKGARLLSYTPIAGSGPNSAVRS